MSDYDYSTDRGLDAIFGQTRHSLELVPGRTNGVPPVETVPNLGELTAEQYENAMGVLAEDKTKYPTFRRLTGIDRMVGSIAPEEIWLIGGRQGNGKSLFCQNLLDDLITQRVPTLYIGTEQSAEILKIKQACLRMEVNPRLVLKPREEEVGSEAQIKAMQAVRDGLLWLSSDPVASLAIFANTTYVNRPELTKWVGGAVRKYGVEAVIIDHIDHMDHGDGVNQRGEIDKTISHVDDLAKQYRIPMIVASQIKRTHGDPLKKYSPPDAEDFAESSKKERVASVVLSLWRPLRTDMDPKELRELLASAKQGTTSEDKIYQPFTMGVRCGKDRLGAAPGQQCMLTVGHGNRLSDDEASAHGIRTTPRRIV